MASCAGKPSSRTHRAGGMRRGRGLHLQHLLGAKVRVKISEALEHQRLGAGLLCGLLDGNAHSGTKGCDPYFLSTSLLALPGTSVGLGLQTPRLSFIAKWHVLPCHPARSARHCCCKPLVHQVYPGDLALHAQISPSRPSITHIPPHVVVSHHFKRIAPGHQILCQELHVRHWTRPVFR